MPFLSFGASAVLLGGATFLLIGVPVIIHLINMMRHRRVQWAAMEFLLASQKKNRTYVLLKQLLLLLMRMLAIAAIIMVIAQPLMKQGNWARFLGGSVTHHVVILDDSFSMSDRGINSSSFEQAKDVILKIAQRSTSDRTFHDFTLMRTSRGGPETELRGVRLTPQFMPKLAEALKSYEPSQMATGPSELLGTVTQILNEPVGENRLVYVISDFRENEWNDPIDLAKAMTALNETGTQVILVNCANKASENLGVVALRPLSRSRSVAVPTQMEVSVKNFGTLPVKGVSVLLYEDDAPRSGLQIDQIAPGKVETRRFSAHFPTAGDHRITASLAPDSVEADNSRYTVLDFPLQVPVLVIDGNPIEKDSWWITSVLNPGGQPGTGINCQIERPQFLAGHPLNQFTSIYLVNVERLDQASVDAIEAYVKAGGGVAVFVGKDTDPDFTTARWYRGGEGFFPVPLGEPRELLVDRVEKTADLQITDHPILRVFAGERNSYINEVSVYKYYSVPKDWKPPEQSTTKVIARLRNDAPLMIERKFGQGRVLAVLTTAGRSWNNWGVNPSFVVTLQEMQSYLAGIDPDTRVLGAPLERRLDPNDYTARVRLFPPSGDGKGPAGKELVSEAQPVEGGLLVKFPKTEIGGRGVYRVELKKVDNSTVTESFAYNVAPDEGNLKMVSGEQLAGRLSGVKYEYQMASDFQWVTSQRAGLNLSEWILYVLIVLLIGEQILAYFLGYHPPRLAKGGAR